MEGMCRRLYRGIDITLTCALIFITINCALCTPVTESGVRETPNYCTDTQNTRKQRLHNLKIHRAVEHFIKKAITYVPPPVTLTNTGLEVAKEFVQ